MIHIANVSGNGKGSERRIDRDANTELKPSVNTKSADVATPINYATS